MPHPDVFEAMEDASKAFIYIPELQRWAGDRFAKAFGAEAGLPTAGASNALILACAACIMRGTELEEYDPLESTSWRHLIQRLPMHTEGLHTEFIVLGDTRSQYDHAIESAGGIVVEAGNKTSVLVDDLHKVYDPDNTAAYYYTVYAAGDQIPISDLVDVAHSYGVPVIVDAAPCLTHKKIPLKIIEDGADLVIFSGGKQFGGPNNTGILIGKKDLIKLAHLQAYPFDGIGRGAKMSRETIVGLDKALELFMKRDDESYYKAMYEKTQEFSSKIDKINGIRSGVLFEPSIVKNITPPSYAWIELENQVDTTLKELHELLREGDPSIRALYEPFFITMEAKDRITFKVEYLLPSDEGIILQRLEEIMT
jgi:L-seryl-tRNA(Ser) seleniumtransferase